MSVSSPPPTYDDPYMTLTPYLQRQHLFSLTWLAYPILSLVFVAFRLQLSLSDAQNAALKAKDNLLASCQAAEKAATSASSLPRYMALATNRQFADAVNASVNGAREALILTLTAMEAIINFVVDMYRSTFLCFLELVVTGGLAIIIGAVEELNAVIGGLMRDLRTNIQNDIGTANSAIQGFINVINKIPFGKKFTPPQISIPSLDSLQNVTLPPSFTQALISLNASIPSVADLRNSLDSLIDKPFELLKQDINSTFNGLSLDPDGLPVPDQNLITFCNQMDSSVIDEISLDLIKVAKIGVVILGLLALILVGLNCLLTWYRWRCMKKHFQFTREAWMTDPTLVHQSPTPQLTLSDHNLMLLHADQLHPLITRILHQLSLRFHLTPNQYTYIQWFLHYILHPPALACFLIGFFGLLSVEAQLLLMGPLISKYKSRSVTAVSDFSTTIASAMNKNMYNQSSLYANDVNTRMDVIQSTINDGVFGWVNGTTTHLNNTINGFYDDVQNAVSKLFGGTILENPVQDFVKCLLGSKVDAIETALTFLHDNLHVNVPVVNNSILILSPDSINEAAQPIAAAALGSGNGSDQGLIGDLVETYAASLKKERIMFMVFLGLYGLVILMGLGIIIWHSVVKPCLFFMGKKKWEARRNEGLENFYGKSEENKSHSLPSPKGSTFKPFWPSRSNSPSKENMNESSAEFGSSNFWESQPPPPKTHKQKPMKLWATGLRAIRRERLKKDGTEDEIAGPIVIGEPVSENHRTTAWYNKVGKLLAKREGEPHEKENDDFWDKPYMKLVDWHQSNWMDILSLTKKSSVDATVIPNPTLVALQEPTKEPQPHIGKPIQSHASVPMDVGPFYEDPRPVPAINSFPIPLYNGFDNAPQSTRPYATHMNVPPPFVMKVEEAPAFPGESAYSSSVSVHKPGVSTDQDDGSHLPSSPVTELLTKTHARRSSCINPFITPFDDEHRVEIISPFDDEHGVEIAYPTGDATRKSVQVNPIVHAM